MIFQDENVELYISHPYQKRKLICKGNIQITDKELIFDTITIPLIDIWNASPISGRKFNFSTSNEDYLVIGHDRFNPLKYVFMFNKLETKMKGTDKYFNLD